MDKYLFDPPLCPVKYVEKIRTGWSAAREIIVAFQLADGNVIEGTMPLDIGKRLLKSLESSVRKAETTEEHHWAYVDGRRIVCDPDGHPVESGADKQRK